MPDLMQQREELASAIDARFGPFDPLLLQAIRAVPRERFVCAADVDRSAEDIPLPLDDKGLANVSAPHAYLLTYQLLALGPGDALVELGTGTGYGAALASFVVGPQGRVLTFEISEQLAAQARTNLQPFANVTVVQGDAIESTSLWSGSSKVACAFAVEQVPSAWIDALSESGMLVAPVGASGSQQLVRVAREGSWLHITHHGGVRYVKNRSSLVTRTIAL